MAYTWLESDFKDIQELLGKFRVRGGIGHALLLALLGPLSDPGGASALPVSGSSESVRSWSVVEWSRLTEPAPPLVSTVEGPGTLPTGHVELPEYLGRAGAARPSSRPGNAFGLSATSGEASFAGASDNGTVVVPDVMGAVGPGHLLITLNTEVMVQNRSGARLSSVTLTAFWASVGTAPFDPKVVYDSASGRFIVTAMAARDSADSAMLLGVSATSDPTGTWYLRSFAADSGDAQWSDYPNLGVNKTWIAVTANMFPVGGGAFAGSKMWVFDKAAALSPGAVTPKVFATGFDDIGSGRGAALTGALTFGSANELYMVDNGWKAGSNRFLRVSKITGTAEAPIWSLADGSPLGDGLVQEMPHGKVVSPSQAGTAQTVDARDDRIQNLVYRNGSLWCVHTAGLPQAAPVRNAVFWYQLDTAANVLQEGVIEDVAGGASYFYPSIGVNAVNDVLIGFAGVSPSTFLGAYTVGRSGRDPPGAMQSLRLLKAGEAKYFRTDSQGQNRWGDYTATVIDPLNDETLWTLQQYAALPGGQDRWGTWWGRMHMTHDLPSTLASVRVFPVPWTPGSGDEFDTKAYPGCGKGLIFEDLNGEATIRIYSVMGDMVAGIEVGASNHGCASWDGKDRSGRDAAGGVYLAVISGLSGENTIKKFLLER